MKKQRKGVGERASVIKTEREVEREIRSAFGSGGWPAPLVQAIYRRSSPGDNDLNGGSVSGVKARSCGEVGVVKSSGSFSFVSGRQRLNKLCRRRLLLPGGGGFLSSSFVGFVSGVEADGTRVIPEEEDLITCLGLLDVGLLKSSGPLSVWGVGPCSWE
ncbi:hypothetical protein HID58_047787 [Brassica napus]|uniref:Uncharacterized protein n=1 Tax=Brassica napus TaxID=3708 RepID=A0ABQ8B0A9_BRANA|nr:hypothetical protein HID58_047787 [Brassica napus]